MVGEGRCGMVVERDETSSQNREKALTGLSLFGVVCATTRGGPENRALRKSIQGTTNHRIYKKKRNPQRQS